MTIKRLVKAACAIAGIGLLFGAVSTKGGEAKEVIIGTGT